MTTTTATPSGFGPDQRDLYLIVAGIVLGILLGPAVFGRVNPELYERYFVGPTGMQEQAEAIAAETAQQIDALQRADATRVAIEEKLAEQQARLGEINQKLQLAQQEFILHTQGRMIALVLATLVLMVIESLMDPLTRMRGRIATARYALLALWLALLLAQPTQLRMLPAGFLLGAIAVALLAALVPLRKKAN